MLLLSFNDSFISINENPINIGAYKSLIKSVKEINTDYIWWIGDDDNIFEEKCLVARFG